MKESVKISNMHIYLLKLTSLLTILYFTVNNTVERNTYPINIKSSSVQISNEENKDFKLEEKKKEKIRKKIIVDLNYHLVKNNPHKENAIHILLNQEGKILGYKPCAIFYPNYFTKNQPKEIVRPEKNFSKTKTNLCLIKVKVHNAKIDF